MFVGASYMSCAEVNPDILRGFFDDWDEDFGNTAIHSGAGHVAGTDKHGRMGCVLRAFVGMMALLLAFVTGDHGDFQSVSGARVLCSSGRATLSIRWAIRRLVTNNTTFMACSLELPPRTLIH